VRGFIALNLDRIWMSNAALAAMRPERCGRSKLSLDRRGQPAKKTAGQTHVVAQDDPVDIRNVRHVLGIASTDRDDNKVPGKTKGPALRPALPF
jgi:hypothetical protein